MKVEIGFKELKERIIIVFPQQLHFKHLFLDDFLLILAGTLVHIVPIKWKLPLSHLRLEVHSLKLRHLVNFSSPPQENASSNSLIFVVLLLLLVVVFSNCPPNQVSSVLLLQNLNGRLNLFSKFKTRLPGFVKQKDQLKLNIILASTIDCLYCFSS